MAEDNKIFIDAFDRARTIFIEDARKYSEMNLSSIATKLIQDVGRYCDRFASDFLIDWQRIIDTIESMDSPDVPQEEIICMGLREDGVDHNAFILSRITNGHPENTNKINISILWNTYRRVYAVKITRYQDESYGEWRTSVELRDIRHEIH